MKAVLRYCIPCIAIVSSYSFAQSNESDLTQFKALVNEQQYLAAYQESLKYIDDWAGEPNYDFLVGLSAYKAGLYDESVFAFERVLMLKPKDIKSRLYLAFAYFKVNNYKASQKELIELKKLPLSANDLQQVDQYLAQIEQYQKDQLSKNQTTVSLAYAYDDNANSGTELDTINIPVLGEITLFDSSKQSIDKITQVNLTHRYQKTINQNQSYFLHGSINHTTYQELDSLNRTQLSLMGGYQLTDKKWHYSASIYAQPMRLDGESYRSAVGGFADAIYAFNASHSLGLTLGISDIDNKQNDELDLDQYSLVAKYNYNKQSHLHALELMRGRESSKLNTAKHNGRDYWQMSYKLTIPQLWGGLFSSSIVYQDIEYAAIHPIFAELRDEQQTSVQLLYSYPLYKELLTSIRIKHTHKDSSLALYGFDKSEAWLSLSYSF